MISQHWFRKWLGAVMQHAITWANIDLDLYHHISSLGHNELMQDNRAASAECGFFCKINQSWNQWILKFVISVYLVHFVMITCFMFGKWSTNEMLNCGNVPVLYHIYHKRFFIIISAISEVWICDWCAIVHFFNDNLFHAWESLVYEYDIELLFWFPTRNGIQDYHHFSSKKYCVAFYRTCMNLNSPWMWYLCVELSIQMYYIPLWYKTTDIFCALIKETFELYSCIVEAIHFYNKIK